MNNKFFGSDRKISRESGYIPQFTTKKIIIIDGYQPTQIPTQQTGGNQQGTSRPTPPSGGSGVPSKD